MRTKSRMFENAFLLLLAIRDEFYEHLGPRVWQVPSRMPKTQPSFITKPCEEERRGRKVKGVLDVHNGLSVK